MKNQHPFNEVTNAPIGKYLGARLFGCFVPGVPKPHGSKSAFAFRRKDGSLGAAVTDSSGVAGKAWRAQLAGVLVEEWSMEDLLEGPLVLDLTFFMPRPKGHYGTGRNADKLKPSAPEYHITTPDKTKLTRCVEDALTGTVYRDDKQVIDGWQKKQYAVGYEQPGVMIEIHRPVGVPAHA